MTLRIEKKLEDDIRNLARIEGVSKSEIVRRSIVEYVSASFEARAWKIGEPLFGKYASGKGNLSQDAELLLKRKLKRKKARAQVNR